jgi:hypothetical protein
MYVTGWRKRYQFLALRQQLIAFCRTLVRRLRADSILFGVHGKPGELRCAGIVGPG